MATASDVSLIVLKTETPVISDSDKNADDDAVPETLSTIDANETLPSNENKVIEDVSVQEKKKQNSVIENKNSSQPECSTSKSNIAPENKCHSNLKSTNFDPKGNAHDASMPSNSETFTVTSDSQIWLECCQYNNTFRAYGGNFRNFHPSSSKLNNNHVSSSHHYSSQGTSSCPQIHRGNNNASSMNYNRNSQYVVHLHVNPGETISFDMGDHVQLIQGPATVRMVSSNNTPPMPMPVQVPPGHMVQQIVDEQGTLRHIILSPQPPVSVGNPYNGTSSGNVTSPISGSAPFYLYPHPPYSVPAQFPPHMQSPLGAQGLHGSVDPMMLQTNGHTANPGLPENSQHLNAFKDERTQRQFIKLKKRLEARQKDVVILPHATSHDGERKPESSQLLDDSSKSKLSEKESKLLERLSAVETPSVSDVTATSAFLKWNAFESKVESEPEDDFDFSMLHYILLLSDKIQNTKAKTVYRGSDTSYPLAELKPATTYAVSLQAELNGKTGSPSESATLKTLSCEPDTPQPPKLLSRTKTAISLKWNAAVDNGAKISSYILEYDEGNGSNDFVELFNGLQKQYKAVKLKPSTCYRFRLAAVNEHGKSVYSDTSCFSTSGTAPSQPLPPVLKEAFINRLSLEWQSRPNDDNYTLQMEDEATLHGLLPVYNGRDTAYTCMRLKRNAKYKFRLSASNDEGSGPWSPVVSFSTLPDKPDPPGKPYLKGRSHSTFFKVTWDPPRDDGGCPITEYILEIDLGEGFSVIYSGDEREFLCENLEPGKSYLFRVQCKSTGGTSMFSEVGTVATLPVIPGKCHPPRLHGKPKAISIQLTWAYPDYDGGSEVLEYEVEATDPDGSSRVAFRGPRTDCVVAGLMPGRQYQFRVRAYNKVGSGQWSDSLEATSGAGSPDMPKDVEAVARSPHCVFVSWTEPANNGAPVTEYRLESKNSEEFELVYSGPSCSVEVKSLIPATLYCYQVQAGNSAGTGPFSEPISCQTPPSSPGPVSTSNIKSIVGASTIALSWKEPLDHGSPILHYNVEMGDNVYATDGDNPEVCVEGLVPETTYRVRIQAINAVGPGSFSSSLKIVTRKLPPSPPLLECCSYSHNSLRLKWGDGKNLEMKTYTLELENPLNNKFSPIYQGPAHTYKVSKLQEMTSYNFRIYASNEEGDGLCSDVCTFVTHRALPPALKAPKVSSITETSCLVEWVAVKPIGEDPLSYRLQLGTKESDLHVIFSGADTSYLIPNLTPGTDYSARVAAIRHCSDSELMGPFSPCTSLCTNTVDLSEPAPPKVFSVISCLKNRQPLSDQQWAMIILFGFTFFAICVAMIIQHVLAYADS